MLLVEDAQCVALKAAGWEVGEAQFREGTTLIWMVYCRRDGWQWIASARARSAAWQALADLAAQSGSQRSKPQQSGSQQSGTRRTGPSET